MFIRKKKNNSGSTSIVIVEKVGRKSAVVKTLGSSSIPVDLNRLILDAEQEIITKQPIINFLEQK